MIKKIAQFIFCWTSHIVEDVDSHKKEIAITYLIFGMVYKTIYKPI